MNYAETLKKVKNRAIKGAKGVANVGIGLSKVAAATPGAFASRLTRSDEKNFGWVDKAFISGASQADKGRTQISAAVRRRQ